jgi:hypothetical protein
MKREMAWHQECLKNHMASNARLKEQIERLQADLARSDAEAGSYADQINLAIANRLEGFDRDKFGKRIRR